MAYTQFTPLQLLAISFGIFLLLFVVTRSLEKPPSHLKKRPTWPKHVGAGYENSLQNTNESMCGGPVYQMMQGSCKSNRCWWDNSQSSYGPNNSGGGCRCVCCRNCTGSQTGTPMWCNWMCHVFPKDSPLHPDSRPNL